MYLHICFLLEANLIHTAQRLFMTNFRPVPLTEHAVFGGKVFAKRSQAKMLEVQQQQQRDYQWRVQEFKEEQQKKEVWATRRGCKPRK
jgi:hypothetical protein